MGDAELMCRQHKVRRHPGWQGAVTCRAREISMQLDLFINIPVEIEVREK